MGKRIIQQARGKGGPRYVSPSHRYLGKISYRIYDDKEKSSLIKGKIIALLNCPGHSAPLMQVNYEDGQSCLIMAPENVTMNKEVATGFSAVVENGNILPLKKIPEGTLVSGIESLPGKGPAFCRTSGTFARIVTKTLETVTIKFPSNKIKELNSDCRAMIGVVAGGGRVDKPWVKAGKKHHAMAARNKLYPWTSAVAMNATDHPFGSGRGRHKGKPSVPPRFAPPGRNVGLIHARRTGRKR